MPRIPASHGPHQLPQPSDRVVSCAPKQLQASAGGAYGSQKRVAEERRAAHRLQLPPITEEDDVDASQKGNVHIFT